MPYHQAKFLSFTFHFLGRVPAPLSNYDGLIFNLIYSNVHKESMKIPIPLINVPIHP